MYSESLTEIANRYGTDKGTIGPTERWQPHNYTDIYQGYLSHMRERPLRLLEIGLGVHGPITKGRNAEGGASMKMWRDYFTNASIFGIDIKDASHLDSARIKTAVVDQGDRQQLQRFVDSIGMLDIIIDDGSHRADHQQVSLGVLFPYLAPGGMYFIEDLRANGLGDENEVKRSTQLSPVHNTRKLLVEYRASSTFLEPNALENASYLRDHIAEIAFHRPHIRGGPMIQGGRRNQPRKQKNPWIEGTETLCMIRKKSGPSPKTRPQFPLYRSTKKMVALLSRMLPSRNPARSRGAGQW